MLLFIAESVLKTQNPRLPVIAFSAYMSQNEGHVVDHHILVFDTVQTIEGNGYNKNTGTGSFVVSQSGVYVFTYSLLITSAGQVCTDFVINGHIYGHVYSYIRTLSVYQTGSSIIVVKKEGDTFFVKTAIGGLCGQG